jgi:hypothetical protein
MPPPLPTALREGGALSYTANGVTAEVPFTGEMHRLDLNSSLWDGPADAVTGIAAGGSDVPAYSVSVTPPGDLRLVNWVLPDDAGATGALPTNADLPITWSGGGQGTAIFSLRGPNARTPALNCEYPASAGSAVIPRVALQALEKVGTYVLFFYSRHRVEQRAGDWTVWATALHYPTNRFNLLLVQLQ